MIIAYIYGVVRVQCTVLSLKARSWHMHPIGFDPLPRRTSVLLAPDDLGRGGVAVADLDVLGGDPHVRLPGPAHHRDRQVGAVGALDEDHVGVVVHAKRDPVPTLLELLVEGLLEVAGEELERTSLGGVLGGQRVGHYPGHHVGVVIGAVVVLGVREDRCPPDASSCAGGGGGLEGLFHEGEVHDCSLGSWIVPVQAILRITQNSIISYRLVFVNS